MTIERALQFAARGFRPIPIRGKIPAISEWQRRASSDPETIRGYWRDGCDVGLATGLNPATGLRLVVLDIDKGVGEDGYAALRECGFDPADETTYSVRTPSGGLHLYYWADEATANAVRVVPGVDVRGECGQVVAPFTVNEKGRYQPLNGNAIQPVPHSLRFAINPEKKAPLSAEARKGHAATLGNADMPGAEEKALAYLATRQTVGEGGGRNVETHKIAAKLWNFGLTQSTVLQLVSAHAGTHFEGDFDDAEIARTVRSAFENAQSAWGRDWRPAFDLATVEHSTSGKTRAGVIRPYLGTEASAAAIPPRPWLTEGLTIRGLVTVLVAPGATSKSTWVLQYMIAQCLGVRKSDGSGDGVLSCATATEMVGARYADKFREPTNCLLINNEDGDDELDRRIEAICRAFVIPREALHNRLFLSSGVLDEWKMAVRDTATRGVAEGPRVDPLIEEMQRLRIGVAAFDPLIAFHGAAENSNDEMQAVTSVFKKIAATANCSVILVHHTTKPSAASSESYAGNINAGRGASAVKDAARVGLTMYTMSKADGEAYAIPEEARHRYVRLDDAKPNLAEAGAVQWYQRAGVPLPNGDAVGIVRAAALVLAPAADKKKKRDT